MPRARHVLYSLLAALLLAGCGQSGPLYIPGNPSQMTVPEQQPAESTDDEAEDTDDADRE